MPADPQVAPRDPARAIDFLRPAEMEVQHGPSPFAQRYMAKVASARSGDLRERVASTDWYHTIELPGGVVTPGFYDHRPLVSHYGLPTALDGIRALDVATFDGFWAFELERRGAEVTALDLTETIQVDLPPPAWQRALDEGVSIPVGTGFRIAADALQSRVRRVERSVYDLDPSFGRYDLVHLGDLLLHLERPLEALRRVRSVTGGTLHLSEAYNPAIPAETVQYLGGWSYNTWWVPSLHVLCQWLVDAGFVEVKMLRTYRLDPASGSGEGPWRAIVQAHA